MLDPDELAAAFTEKTKMIVVTTPNNPLGKVAPLLCFVFKIFVTDNELTGSQTWDQPT